MTSTPSQQNIPAPAGGRQVNPSEVGWQFVPQYYTFVNKYPHRLHCFYTKNSTFINGTEGEDTKACYGQHEIHNRILGLNYQDCKVFIHSVDAQSSANNGIIIQVIGEMSNRGEPWKKFVQTFFLAEQPNGYFVLNDIFRFLKEDTAADDDEEGDITEETTSAVPAASEEPPRYSEQQQVPSAAPAVTVPVEHAANSYEPEAPAPAPVPHPVAAPAPHVIERAATPPVEPVEEKHEEHGGVNGINGHADTAESVDEPKAEAAAEPELQPPEPVTTVAEPSPSPAVEPPAPTFKAPSPAPAAAPPSQAAPPQQPAAPPVASGPKTWATLAASNNRKWGSQIATDAKGVSAAAPQAPSPVQTQPKPVQNGNVGGGGGGAPPQMGQITTGQCFVKAVTENVDEKVLREALVSRFGPVKELEIVRSKACAFLEFTTVEAARKAIQASLSQSQGGEGGIRLEGKPGPNGLPPRVIVETRKERGERPISTRGRGGPPGGGEGRGSGFSDRGGPGPRGRGAPRGRGVPAPAK